MEANYGNLGAYHSDMGGVSNDFVAPFGGGGGGGPYADASSEG